MISKKIIISLFSIIILANTTAFADDYVIHNDSISVKIMRSLQYSNHIKALKIGFKIIENGNAEKANRQITESYKTIGDIFSDQGYFGLAEEYYARAMNNYFLLNDTLAIAWLYVEMGNLYFKNNYYNNAKKNTPRLCNYLKTLN